MAAASLTLVKTRSSTSRKAIAYLAYCDLLFDALAASTPVQHRALLRLEDIDPTYNTNTLKSVADWLKSQNVPFGFQIIPYYLDPLNANNNGTKITLQSKPAMVSMIKYMQSKGGIMMCHGYTHQYGSVANPYSGASGDDCEFYQITMNSDNTLNFQGPVAEDSLAWAQGRFAAAQQLYKAAGFTMPQFMTFPSYAASAADYAAANGFFTAASERRLYFTGLLSGQPINYSQLAGQYMPYTVRDVYNMKVLADTLGGIEPLPYFSYPGRLPADLIADAQRNLVVRDGWASFLLSHVRQHQLSPADRHRDKELGLYVCSSNGCLTEPSFIRHARLPNPPVRRSAARAAPANWGER